METIYATFSLISQGLCSILNCKNIDFNDIYRLFHLLWQFHISMNKVLPCPLNHSPKTKTQEMH